MKWFRFFTLLLLIFLSVRILESAERVKPGVEKAKTVPEYSYKALRLAFPGLKSVVADAVYMKLCVIIGERTEFKPEELRRIVRDFRVIHRLDPYFFDPYYMEAAYVSWRAEGEPEIIGEINRNLEEFGLKFCRDWRIPFFLGFNYFYFLNKLDKAAHYLKMASKYPEAPDYLEMLAQRLFARAGKFDVAMAAIEEQLKSVTDEKVKDYLKKRLRSVQNLKLLAERIEDYRRMFGKCPENLEELVKAGLLKRIPEDPLGGKYFIDKQNCTPWTTGELKVKRG